MTLDFIVQSTCFINYFQDEIMKIRNLENPLRGKERGCLCITKCNFIYFSFTYYYFILIFFCSFYSCEVLVHAYFLPAEDLLFLMELNVQLVLFRSNKFASHFIVKKKKRHSVRLPQAKRVFPAQTAFYCSAWPCGIIFFFFNVALWCMCSEFIKYVLMIRKQVRANDINNDE